MKAGRQYRNRFRTHPAPDQALGTPLTFAVIGDFGVGIRKSEPDEAAARDRRGAAAWPSTQHDVRFVLTTGDNIYAGKRVLGLPIGDHGDEDDDWFFTFYQPYRYFLNRIPFYPSIGNHDSAETEERDDRDQVLDNFFLRERMATDEATGKASLDPGSVLPRPLRPRRRADLPRHVEGALLLARAAVRASGASGVSRREPSRLRRKTRCGGGCRSVIIRRTARDRGTTTRATCSR